MDVIDLTSSTNVVNEFEHHNDEEDDEGEIESIGFCNVSIVGIRYYPGVAHPGEYVSLAREPSNPYDRNAIRVDNIHGDKVGHIKATMAVALSPILDACAAHRHSGNHANIKLLGSIPRPGNHWNLPLVVEFVAYASSRELLQGDALNSLKILCLERLSRSYIPFQATNRIINEDTSTTSSSQRQHPIQTIQVDWKTQLQQLDEVFEQGSKDQLSKLPKDIPLPTQYFRDSTQFYPHQVIGMQWMLFRETSDSIVAPFFEKIKEKGKDMWLSEITHASQEREPSCVKGGILADDMGLGKTLQTIGLIFLNPPCEFTYPLPIPNNKEEEKEDMVSSCTNSMAMTPQNDQSITKAEEMLPPVDKQTVKKQKVATLKYIIAKVDTKVSELSTIKKKKDELVQACLSLLENGTLTPQEFHSCCNNSDSLSSKPYKRVVTPSTQQRACSIPENPFCTLIVCPISVMSNWVHQIEAHVKPGVLRVQIYHGPDRYKILDLIRANEVDIVITAYTVLASELSVKTKISPPKQEGHKTNKKRKNLANQTPISDIIFHRIILDEAHVIRNTKTRMFQACKALQSRYKFCVTGTPLQNKPDDVHALFDFLRVDPLGNKIIFQRSISQPIQHGDREGLARLRAMMGHISLRRTKATVADSIKLAEKEFQIRIVPFPKDSITFQVHDTLYQSARIALLATLEAGEQEALKQYTSIFETLLRIRQACCCISLVPKDRRRRAQEVMEEFQKRGANAALGELTGEEGKALFEKLQGVFSQTKEEEEKENPECAICLDEFTLDMAIILRHCSHIFCKECISKVLSMPCARTSCPMCRIAFTKQDLIPMSMASSVVATAETIPKDSTTNVKKQGEEGELEVSPKVQAMLDAIQEMKVDEKGVIFSQFTKFLNIIEQALFNKGYSFTRLDGTMNAREKMSAIELFNLENSGPKFILCSLKAAGVGINLTRGNHIILMDSWWNKAAEDQAMDRVHRIGQKRNVRVIKFVMENSVEERMIALQDSKAAMCKGSMEKLNAEEMRTARVSQLRNLFQIPSSNFEEDS